MSDRLRFALAVLALVALAVHGPAARQAGVDQARPGAVAATAAGAQARPAADAQAKPADAKPEEELPPDFKAFNAAAAEKDAHARVAALEQFVADHPESVLAATARTQIQSSALAALTGARKKYLDLIAAQVDEAKAREATTPLYPTYNRIATTLLNADLLEEAEDHARKGLDAMDEQKYIETRKQAAERALATYKKAAADPAPPAPPAAPATPSRPGFAVSMVDGVMVARLAPPRAPAAAPAAPRPPPPVPSDDSLKATFRSERASALATLGRILVRRGKNAEGEEALKEAYAARPASATMATIARVLAESAKKAGDEERQIEYLGALVLSGRFTAAERDELEAVYRKRHNGSAGDLEAMLDERYRREHTRFAVTPYERRAGPNARVVLAEVFTGAG